MLACIRLMSITQRFRVGQAVSQLLEDPTISEFEDGPLYFSFTAVELSELTSLFWKACPLDIQNKRVLSEFACQIQACTLLTLSLAARNASPMCQQIRVRLVRVCSKRKESSRDAIPAQLFSSNVSNR